MFLLGLLMEVTVVLYVLKNDEVEIVFKFNGLGWWGIYDTGPSGFIMKRL